MSPRPQRTPRPEVVIGLVGAVGTDLYLVADLLSTILGGYGYQVQDVISLSQLLNDVHRRTPLPGAPREAYIDKRMTEGNRLRKRLHRGGCARTARRRRDSPPAQGSAAH